MHFLDHQLTEEDLAVRARITRAVLDAVVEACAGDGADAALVNMNVAIDGVATALASIAFNVPDYRTPKGSRLIAEDVQGVVRRMIRSMAESGKDLRFAHPAGDIGGKA